MRKTPKRLAKAAAGAAVVFVTAFIAAPPAFAAPTLNVSQTEGLKDGTVVTISGSGFTPNLGSIAIGQCIEGMKGPGDCNTGGGATFKPTDAQGNVAEFTLTVKEKFGAFDCTKQQCVFGAQPLPNVNPPDVVAANTVYYDLSFGDAAPAPATPAPDTTTAASPSEELPKTGPGEEIAVLVLGGLALLTLGGAVLHFTPRARGGVV